MTIAVLPIEAPKDDAEGERFARDTGHTVQALQEERILWSRVPPRAPVERTTSAQPNLRQLGAAPGVHFLLRGTIVQGDAGLHVLYPTRSRSSG
jgi:TolB-like protein